VFYFVIKYFLYFPLQINLFHLLYIVLHIVILFFVKIIGYNLDIFNFLKKMFSNKLIIIKKIELKYIITNK
jgi:hypothetical protein